MARVAFLRRLLWRPIGWLVGGLWFLIGAYDTVRGQLFTQDMQDNTPNVLAVIGQSPTWTLVLVGMLGLWIVTVEGAYRLVQQAEHDNDISPLSVTARDPIAEAIDFLNDHNLVDVFLESIPALSSSFGMHPDSSPPYIAQFTSQGLTRTERLGIQGSGYVRLVYLSDKGTDVFNRLRPKGTNR